MSDSNLSPVKEEAAAVTATESKEEPVMTTEHTNSIVEDFSRDFLELFGTLAASFEDVETVVSEFKKLEEELKEYERRVALVKDWHEHNSTVYTSCRFGNEAAFIDVLGDFIHLKNIGFKELYIDSGLGDDDRKALVAYVNTLNVSAGLYHGIPSNVLHKLETLATDVPDDISNMTMQDVVDFSSKAFSSLNPEDMRDVGKNLPQLFDAVGKEGGISQMLQGFGLPEGVGIDSLFQSALQFSQQMLNGEEGGVNMSQILSGLGGGPLGNGPSGGPPGSGTNGGADNSNE